MPVDSNGSMDEEKTVSQAVVRGESPSSVAISPFPRDSIEKCV